MAAGVVKRVLLASPRGYCAGVERAVETVERALRLYGPPVYVRRQIVHNAHVVRDLETRGAVFVADESDVPEGATLVLSAHGVAPSVHRRAGERRLNTIDATCPLVTKVHVQARRYAADGYAIVLIGHAGHEEGEGTRGEAPHAISLVGLTSGASAPESIVVRVCEWFRRRGVREIENFASVYEDVVFKLPVELRRAETPAA